MRNRLAAQKTNGFTAVELLITLIVGVVFVVAFYQIYSVITSDAAVARNRAYASNIAYEQLKVSSYSATQPCAAQTPSASLPAGNTLPQPAAIAVTITCPYGATGISVITATVTFGNPQEVVKHVIFKN